MRYKTRQNSTFQINISIGVLSLSILFICFSCKNKEAQKDKYYSTEEQTYNTNRFKQFDKEKDTTAINYLKQFSDYIQVEQSDTSINPFRTIYDYFEYNEHYDSLVNKNKKLYNEKKISKSAFILNNNKLYKDKIEQKGGFISDLAVLRVDSFGKNRIILYSDVKLEKLGIGYWIAISSNKGKTWKKYYTGLNNTYFHIKSKYKIPFVLDKNHIQLEGTLIKPKGSRFVHGYFDFSVVQNGIIIKIDLNKLIKDSDNDGLTDIIETKLMTNSYSNDTDNDGIPDSIDCNPRFKNIDNKYTLLYKFLIEPWNQTDSCFISLNDTSFFKTSNQSKCFKEKQTYLIKTSDKRLENISHLWNRYIIVSSYSNSQPQVNANIGLKEIHISPLFKIDNKPNLYKINISIYNASTTFLINETKTGWYIKGLESEIAD